MHKKNILKKILAHLGNHVEDLHPHFGRLFNISDGPRAFPRTQIVLSNADGWAEMNIRNLWSNLEHEGYSTLLSAPANNETEPIGSLDVMPSRIGSEGCGFGSCPPGSPEVGHDATIPQLYYVNSYPATAMRYAVNDFADELFGDKPDLALVGVNIGTTLGPATFNSSAVGAAVTAANMDIPTIVFSGSTGNRTAFNAPGEVPTYVSAYAGAAADFVRTLVNARYIARREYKKFAFVDHKMAEKLTGKLFLPKNVWLNVNFPPVTNTSCWQYQDFYYVMTRMYPATLPWNDVKICDNKGKLVTEEEALATKGCYATVSVGAADSKLDADIDAQKWVYERLKKRFICLPTY